MGGIGEVGLWGGKVGRVCSAGPVGSPSAAVSAGYKNGAAGDAYRRAPASRPCRRRTQPTATNTRPVLGVLGIESALDLVKHPLLLIGEWHSSLLADRLSTNHRYHMDIRFVGN